MKRGRNLLGDERLLAFFRFIASEDEAMAVSLVTSDQKEGSSIDDLFADEGDFGFTLQVEEISELIFEIYFGCIAGPDAGDGGQWTVTYDSDGNVVSAGGETMWMC